MATHIQNLCAHLVRAYGMNSRRVELAIRIGDVQLDLDRAVPCSLIVNELVSNALKHAFPDGRAGKILVGYRTRGPNWSLSVTDDGVGMPKDPANAKPGLGTSIVEALAKQLEADVRVTAAYPGTTVAITHAQIAAVRPAAAAV